jgi:hypothetical protein
MAFGRHSEEMEPFTPPLMVGTSHSAAQAISSASFSGSHCRFRKMPVFQFFALGNSPADWIFRETFEQKEMQLESTFPGAVVSLQRLHERVFNLALGLSPQG